MNRTLNWKYLSRLIAEEPIVSLNPPPGVENYMRVAVATLWKWWRTLQA